METPVLSSRTFIFVVFPDASFNSLVGITLENWVRNKDQFPRALVYQFFKTGHGYNIVNDDQIFIPDHAAGIEKSGLSKENHLEPQERDSDTFSPEGLVCAFPGIEEGVLDITETFERDSRLEDSLSILKQLL